MNFLSLNGGFGLGPIGLAFRDSRSIARTVKLFGDPDKGASVLECSDEDRAAARLY